MVQLGFRAGTIEILGLAPGDVTLPSSCAWDPRAACFRAPASAYADVVRTFVRGSVSYQDDARRYETLERSGVVHRQPRPYQQEALAAWQKAGGRGVVVLPTGAGKTLVAHLAIEDRKRSTLVVTPTLDLVRQWYDGLRATFGGPIGLLGGGEHDVQAITVATYDSAYLHMENLGARFGLLVFDECHHLPGPTYALSARPTATSVPLRMRTMCFRKAVPSTSMVISAPCRATSTRRSRRRVVRRSQSEARKAAKSCSPTSRAAAARIAARSSGARQCQLRRRYRGERTRWFHTW